MKRLVMLALLLVSVSSIYADGLSRSEINDLYSQAKRSFTEAVEVLKSDPPEADRLFRQSSLYYERIVNDGGIKNGKLFYNLGNVYFRLGDIGRAILNYRRAQKLMPNDPNLIANLAYARSIQADAVDAKERTLIGRVVFFWYFDLSSRARFVAFIVSFSLIFLFATLHLFVKRRGLALMVPVLAFIALLFLGSLIWDSVDAGRNPAAVVLVDEVTGRKGNSETYQPSFQEPLHAGTEVIIREERGNWALVELLDGRRSWLPKSSFERI